MARRENKLDTYIDTLSSGDSNNMQSKQRTKEVNNNEVDELSKEFLEMGCIVDAMKRPPNICVETCVYESDSEHSVKSQTNNDEDINHDEDAYSDEFEEDKSEEEESVKTIANKLEKSDSRDTNQSSVKLSKSQSSMSSTNKAGSISGRSGRSEYGGKLRTVTVPASQECPSVGPSMTSRKAVPTRNRLFSNEPSLRAGSIVFVKLTSVSVPSTRRINMSFTNERLREIERHNHILLTKILSARNTKKSSIPPREQPIRKPVPSAALSRKNHQKKIDHDNMILLKKIQRAKSSALSIRR